METENLENYVNEEEDENGELDCNGLTFGDFTILMDIIKLNNDVRVECITLTKLNDLLQMAHGKEMFLKSNGPQMIFETFWHFEDPLILRKLLTVLDTFYSDKNFKVNEQRRKSGKSYYTNILGGRLSPDNKYGSELLLVLMHVSLLNNQDVELNRFIAKSTLNLCKYNRDLPQRKCILTILFQCLTQADPIVIRTAVSALYNLTSTPKGLTWYFIDDVIESGICQKLPELLNFNDDKVKTDITSVMCYIQHNRDGVELVHGFNLLPKFSTFITSDDTQLRLAGVEVVCQMSGHSMNIDSFYESPDVITQLWKFALTPRFEFFVQRSIFYAVSNIIKFSNDEQKLQMVREGRILDLNKAMLVTGKDIWGKEKLQEAADDLHSIVTRYI